MELFEKKELELAVGDKIVYRRNTKALGIYNGEQLIIRDIKNNVLICERDNLKKVAIALNHQPNLHFDYGYAATPLQKKHLTTKSVIAYQSSNLRQSHQRSFYEILSQAKEQVWFYTENKEMLCQHLKVHTADKSTAIDTLLQSSGSRFLQDASRSDYLRLLDHVVARQIEYFKNKEQIKKTPAELAKEAVDYALAHLTEREAAFEHKQVLKIAFKRALGEIDSETLQAAVQEAENNGELVRGLFSIDGTRWTTREGIEIEREILQLATKDNGQLTAIADDAIIEKHITERQPKAEHTNAVRSICSNTDRHLLIQGYAGTGKTTMLMHVEPILRDTDAVLEKQGYKLLCLAPTHVAVKELKARGLEAQTLDSFLVAQQKINNRSLDKIVLAVDESSMASNKQMLALLIIVQENNMRGIYVGDRHQHPSICAGKPFILMQNIIKTIYLKDIERQKDPILKKAVEESYLGQFRAAFDTLKDKIIEVGPENVDGKMMDNRKKRLTVIGDHYLSYKPEERAQVQIICAGNEDRIQQNLIVREELKERGELYGSKCETTILVSEDLSETEKTRASNYQIGQFVRFGFSQKELGIFKGDYLKVEMIFEKENYLVLTKNDNQRITWQPSEQKRLQRVGVEVYNAEERELMAGDLIRWTRTDKKLGLFSPELAKVDAIDGGLILLQPVQASMSGASFAKERLVMQAHEQKYQHWDHAYAITGYNSQGRTIKKTLINFESYRINLMHQPALLVALTRAEYDLTLYTDNAAALLEQIEKHDGQKSSALEIIGEWRDSRSSKPFHTSQRKPAKEQHYASKSSQHTSQQDLLRDGVKEKAVPPASNKLGKPLLDAHRITELLYQNAEFVLERIMGQPKEADGQTHRYGSNKGSLVVTLSGEKRGMWFDFQTNEGGNLLHLVAKQLGLNMQNKADFKRVLEQSAKLLGVTERFASSESNHFRKAHTTEQTFKPQELANKQKKTAEYARQLAKESLAIQGTIAEKYLRWHRGIDMDSYPDSFRFHPSVYSALNKAKLPALLAIARDAKGEIQAVQAIYLDEKTANKVTKFSVKVVKQTFGSSSHFSVDIKPDARHSGPTYVAEGPETGLSIAKAYPGAHIKITLGGANFKNIDPNTVSKEVVLCQDNDRNNSEADKNNRQSAERLVQLGKTVLLAKPEQVKDYNDVLNLQGVEAIRHNIEQAKSMAILPEKLNNLPPIIDKNIKTLSQDKSAYSIDKLAQHLHGLVDQKWSDIQQDEAVKTNLLNDKKALDQAVFQLSKEERSASNELNKLQQQFIEHSLGKATQVTPSSPEGQVKKIEKNKDNEREI